MFQKSCFCSSVFFWTRRMRIGQPCRKNFDIRSKKFIATNTTKIYKIIFCSIKTTFSSNCSSGHVQCNFDNPVVKLFIRERNFQVTCVSSVKLPIFVHFKPVFQSEQRYQKQILGRRTCFYWNQKSHFLLEHFCVAETTAQSIFKHIVNLLNIKTVKIQLFLPPEQRRLLMFNWYQWHSAVQS